MKMARQPEQAVLERPVAGPGPSPGVLFHLIAGDKAA
jgi:hypothetical protein